MRTPHGHFPEYHTSADNLDFVNAQALHRSFVTAFSLLWILERNITYLNTNPKCEPQLGKRGLYRSVAGQTDGRTNELAMLWVLNLSDGRYSLLDVAERARLPFDVVCAAADRLVAHGLLREIGTGA